MTILFIITIITSLLAAAIPVPGTDVWFPQFIAVSTFGFLFVAIRISQMSVPLGLFYAYCVFSTVFIAKYDFVSVIILMMVGLCGMMAQWISTLNSKQRSNILKAMVVLLFFQIAWGILQRFNLDPIFKLFNDASKCDTVGFSGSHNQYSLFIAMLSPLVFSNIWLTCLVMAGIIISTSFSGFTGIFVAYLFYHRKSKLHLISGLALFGAFLIAFNLMVSKDFVMKFNERKDIWALSIGQVMNGKLVNDATPGVKKILTCNPAFGYGLGKFFYISPGSQGEAIKKNTNGSHRYEHAHNDYVEILFDLGLVGAILFIINIVCVFGRLRLIRWDEELNIIVSCLIAVAVCALSIYTIHTAYNGMMIAILIGLLYGKIKAAK